MLSLGRAGDQPGGLGARRFGAPRTRAREGAADSVSSQEGANDEAQAEGQAQAHERVLLDLALDGTDGRGALLADVVPDLAELVGDVLGELAEARPGTAAGTG